ncbi:IS30 family transposase [Mycoplasmopsis arginini]|uniref:IS30 family transposase n=1 Tax=Mycoplasmopsis arginini TaxID=2094 RepID=UPI003518F347
MFDFFKNYQEIYEKVKKLSPINKAKLAQNKYKFLQKRSVANLINDFKQYAKESNIEIAIPSLQAIYYLINSHKLIDFKILPIKKTITGLKRKKRMTGRSRITFAKSIEERPEYINNRSEFGHYEIDTVILNKRSKYCYLTLLERKSRKLFIKVIQRNSDSMANGLKTIIKENKLKIKSITMDNWSENVKLNTIDNKIDIYVCHPYCSFEKGSIENCHKFIRQFMLKGVNRKYALIDEFVLKMQNEINSLNRNYKDLKIQTFASKCLKIKIYNLKTPKLSQSCFLAYNFLYKKVD